MTRCAMKQAKQLGLKGRYDKLTRLRGFPIHLCVYVVVIAGLAAINLTENPSQTTAPVGGVGCYLEILDGHSGDLRRGCRQSL